MYTRYFYESDRTLFGAFEHLGNGNFQVRIWKFQDVNKLHPDDMLREDLQLDKKGLTVEDCDNFFNGYKEIDPNTLEHNNKSSCFEVDIGTGG